MQFTPIGFSVSWSWSLTWAATPTAPSTDASVPAGAFHTPRVLSVRANSPAIMPDGGAKRVAPLTFEYGSGISTHGKYSDVYVSLGENVWQNLVITSICSADLRLSRGPKFHSPPGGGSMT